jgi:CTP:molybdopterin cytidylyltransferase MocA
MSARKIGAVVAAAGLSSRMGAFKPLLPFDGVTVIERCIANLRMAGASEIVVVTGHRAGKLTERLANSGVTVVHNPLYAETQMFDSLCLGLRALPADCDTILLTPGDVPLVKPETVRALLAAEAGFACPVCAGRRGHPVALDAKWLAALLRYAGEGGLRGAVKAIGIPTAEVEVDDAGMPLDLDTPADYEAALKLLEQE